MIEFLAWDAQVAQENEPGTIRFDVFGDPNDDQVFYFYEAYVDHAAFKAHMANPPFQKLVSGQMAACVDSVETVMEMSEAMWPLPGE